MRLGTTLAALLMLFGARAHAQPVSLDTVLRSVDRHYPLVEAARHELRAARAERDAADGGFDPVLSASGTASPLGYYEWGRANVEIAQPTPLWGTTFYGGWRIGRGFGSEDDIPSYYRMHETLDGGELRAGVRVPLWQDGPIDARRARQWRAAHSETVEERELESAQLSTRVAAAQAYYRWVAAVQKLAIADGLLRLAEDRDTFIRARVAAGALADIEELENRRAILARRAQAVAARRGVERTAITLSLFLRDRQGRPVVPSPSRAPDAIAVREGEAIALPAAIERALAQRPEVARADALIERQRVSTDFAENRVGPRIDLNLEASTDLGSASEDAQARLSPAVVEGSVVLSVPIPLRESRGTLDRERAALAALREEARLARDRVAAAVRDAFSALQATDEGATLAQQAAEAAEALANAERRRFDLGAVALFVVNLREQTAAESQAASIDARADYAIATIELQAATGELLDAPQR